MLGDKESIEVHTEDRPRIKDGRTEQIVCDIPIKSPKIPSKEEIAGYGLPKTEQYFRKIEEPKDKALMAAHIKKMWHYRWNGYWFYNNGFPTWITGTHFMFLNSWRIDVGFPKYKDSDRRNFWHWWYCENDENSYGQQELGWRREGKSYRFGVKIYDRITRGKQRVGGIQSKTQPDAKALFAKVIVSPWRKLPWYWKPKTDSTTNPKTKLQFLAPAKKGYNAVDDEDELESSIDFQSSEETAYDGYKLYAYGGDEEGKSLESNILERWGLVKFCLYDPNSNSIVGKSIHTSTAEEMEVGGGKNYYEMWLQSNYLQRNAETKQTESGLYRYFLPAYDGFLVDKYGNSLIEESKRILLAKRSGISNPAARNAEIRRFPFTVAEAFRQDAKHCLFDSEKLITRMEIVRMPGKNLTIRGNLVYLKEQYGDVIWVPNANGRWLMGSVGVPQELQNKVGRRGDRPAPLNTGNYVMGADPYGENKTSDEKRQSKGAAYLFRLYDPNIDGGKTDVREFQTNRFILEYYYRAASVYELAEDWIKMFLFAGCQVNIEKNNSSVRHYIEEKGFVNFLMRRPEITQTSSFTRLQQEAGTPASNATTRTGVFLFEGYLATDDFGHGEGHGYTDNIDFPTMLEQALEFQIENTTKFDAMMAAIYTLIAANKHVSAPKKEIQVQQYFQQYDNRELVSKPILV